MNLVRGIPLLPAALSLLCGCATIDTSNLTPSCRSQYDACLNSCQRSSPPPSRQPPDSVQGNAERLTPDTQTPACTDSCNQQAKRCT
ncbi:hypothetical protein KH5H1_39170 [Corallococcus caeni]|uniref:Lipoprotein n=2 Tax=Corallococcus TaxID=83461 RepID=A0A7Y4NC58_9BACT|nr:hypothetical protein [Corallococcus exercitus]NOK08081.1 hypothetical protein [Corallococcus exercitus]GMT99797.1 hypothetical protein KH5H1_39170 [Corallococcus sp. KH5-1]GMU08948.1 hypothetical protein ASNO1_52010 [Corallococcus sp. NO1]